MNQNNAWQRYLSVPWCTPLWCTVYLYSEPRVRVVFACGGLVTLIIHPIWRFHCRQHPHQLYTRTHLLCWMGWEHVHPPPPPHPDCWFRGAGTRVNIKELRRTQVYRDHLPGAALWSPGENILCAEKADSFIKGVNYMEGGWGPAQSSLVRARFPPGFTDLDRPLNSRPDPTCSIVKQLHITPPHTTWTLGDIRQVSEFYGPWLLPTTSESDMTYSGLIEKLHFVFPHGNFIKLFIAWRCYL